MRNKKAQTAIEIPSRNIHEFNFISRISTEIDALNSYTFFFSMNYL